MSPSPPSLPWTPTPGRTSVHPPSRTRPSVLHQRPDVVLVPPTAVDSRSIEHNPTFRRDHRSLDETHAYHVTTYFLRESLYHYKSVQRADQKYLPVSTLSLRLPRTQVLPSHRLLHTYCTVTTAPLHYFIAYSPPTYPHVDIQVRPRPSHEGRKRTNSRWVPRTSRCTLMVDANRGCRRMVCV